MEKDTNNDFLNNFISKPANAKQNELTIEELHNRTTRDSEHLFLTQEKRAEYLDAAFKDANAPGYDTALINSFRGFRAYPNGPAMMPASDNLIGLMFLTRPEINLSDDNVRRSEGLVKLLGVGPSDYGSYIRGLLDRRWANGKTIPMLDNELPFISCLNEYLKTSTGFSDLSLSTNTSEPGLRQQVYQTINSKLDENGQFTISQTYYNPKPSIIQAIFQIWLTYISEVKSGDNQVYPYLDYLMCNRIDYDCRIYHLIMNKDSQYLESIFAGVQSIPTSFPAGSIANIDRTASTNRGEGQDDFSIQFSTVGMRFDELSLINSFNRHSFRYASGLYEDAIKGAGIRFSEVEPNEYEKYAYRMYPLLLLRTSDGSKTNNRIYRRSGIKLTWWAIKDKVSETANNNSFKYEVV